MIAFFRKHARKFSLILLFCFVLQGLSTPAFALTTGPAQPETQQFAPANMDNMVDPFTGDFSYNLPLLDVGDYPLNLNYASGITPDEEASWVGLGWNLNVGAITRSMRGLPDDFGGEEVSKEFSIKPNQTYGLSGNLSPEIYGLKLPKSVFDIGFTANLFYNNYNGFGVSTGVSPSISAGLGNNTDYTGSLGLGLSLSSESGIDVTPKIGLSSKQTDGNNETTLNTSLSFPYNTREGLKGMTLSASSKTEVVHENRSREQVSGASNQGFMGFATPTYTPALEHDMYNINASLNFSFSPTDPATEMPAFGFGGYYSGQFLKNNEKKIPAYGYMYSGLSQSENKLMDFNREKDGGYNKFTTNLPVTNHTYDVFQVSGQGISGTYRLHRGDVGAVHDPGVKNDGYSPTLGVEIGVGSPPSAKVGVDLEYNHTQASSGKWPDGNSAIRHFKQEVQTGLNEPGREMIYFKKIGESTPEHDSRFLDDIQHRTDVVRHELVSDGTRFLPGDLASGVTNFLGDGKLTGNYELFTKNSNGVGEQLAVEPVHSDNSREERKKRNTAFTTLTSEEAEKSAVIPAIQNYEYNHFNWYGKNDPSRYATSDKEHGYRKEELSRISENRKKYHISEARVTNEEGKRYIYGIPVYNTLQEEATFAVSPGNSSTGTVNYTPGTEDSRSNKKGLDNYYSKVKTPAYAHSYLLTCILSNDYVDRDAIPGPSDGDLGTYTKFNYTRVTEKYKWRTPCTEEGVAAYSEGMQGTSDDDKGNYVYGEKEIWYLHSIETRTHVAEFYLSDRLDALAALGNGGGIDKSNSSQKRLDKIVLYSKADKANSIAEPLKTVHFEYDYSLCPNTPNSKKSGGSKEQNPTNGKLTLKKVWFTYSNSHKGVLNPYVFSYAGEKNGVMNPALNPSYSFKNYDRWGNYKANSSEAGKSNAEFPYALQTDEADLNAAVYALSSIKTPVGSTIKVFYESDDYAYVQNKRAMRMFSIAEVKGGNLYNSNSLIIDLAEGFKPEDVNNADNEFRNKYLSGIDLMYYKVLLRVIKKSNRYEYVPGYAELNIPECKLIQPTSGDVYKQAELVLRSVPVTGGANLINREVNPIVRNGLMFARLHLSRELQGNLNANDNEVEQILRAILKNAEQTFSLATGFVDQLISDNNSDLIEASHSFVKLNEPDKIKKGGGHRVKAIVTSDNWGLMRSSKESSGSPSKETSYYGQSYDYSFVENGVKISAGVAAYEPILGGEENPFRRPVYVKEKVPLAPAKEYFLEEPFGESFFPSPTVGYRKVSITALKITGEITGSQQLTSPNGTGRVEHEFYTAYDFPSITRRSGLTAYRHKPNIVFKFMKFDCRDLVTCSQGYNIELNDMHGKPKAQRVYPDAGEENEGGLLSLDFLQEVKPISEIEYRYKVNANGSLNNQVTYIKPDLSIVRESDQLQLGVEVDMVQDERFNEKKTTGGGVQLNVKYIQLAIVPVFVPTAFPDINYEETRFRSLVTTKVVHKYGILESTTVKEDGASITTKNLAWDFNTGKVLLTEVENEFNDPVYNFSYPAYWGYDRMGSASTNEGLVFSKSKFSLLKTSALKDGDEIYLDGSSDAALAYFDDGKLINQNGEEITASYERAKIIRSGARNALNSTIGNVTSLVNPIKSGNTHLLFEKVLTADMIRYRDEWKRACNCKEYHDEPVVKDIVIDVDNLESRDVENTNRFTLGVKGNMRPWIAYIYLTERQQTKTNDNLHVRTDGYFKDYESFWVFNDGQLEPYLPTKTKWQYTKSITNYNSLGMELENVDALGRYSMALYGYGKNLPVAVGNNSQQKNSGFDGFEDYDYKDCEDDHLSWREYRHSVTNKEAHTGRRSIVVGKSSSLKIKKPITNCGYH